MKKITLIISVIILTACSGVKTAEQSVDKGHYDSAIETAVTKLQNNSNRKNADEYITILEEAYAKANQQDMDRITFLTKSDSPAYYEEIYNLYNKVNNRQYYVKPLLPLYIASEKRNAKIITKDYTDAIIAAKNNLSEYLYQTAMATFNQEQPKQVYRNLYEDLEYLNRLNPHYKSTDSLLQVALDYGTEYYMVNLVNSTEVIIPQQLEQDLLNFNSYGLDSKWAVFHSNPSPEMMYDYELVMDFQDILISPETIKEKEIIKEKQIKDGKTYVKDADGRIVKDSLGNNVMTDKFKTIVCKYYTITQNKTASVAAMFSVIGVADQQVVSTYPLETTFVFEHNYATYKGDKRALEKDYLDLLERKAVAFPTNEQMVYDAGEDLKDKMKHIIKKYAL